MTYQTINSFFQLSYCNVDVLLFTDDCDKFLISIINARKHDTCVRPVAEISYVGTSAANQKAMKLRLGMNLAGVGSFLLQPM